MGQEYDRESTYGYDRRIWERAKEQIRQSIIDQIRMDRAPLTYSEVVALVRGTIDFIDPHNWVLHHMLGQLSEEEDDASRGLISAFVVRQDDGRPGNGFFLMAEERGRDIRDRDMCWATEISFLQAVWGRRVSTY